MPAADPTPTPPSVPSMPSITRALRPLRRALLLRRRAVALGLVCLAGLLLLAATRTPPPSTRPVLVAADDLAAGTVLARADVETRGFAPGTGPAGALTSPRAVLGRRLAVGVRSGEPLGAHRLAGSGVAASAPGLTTVPVRLVDAAALLRTGDRVDLVSSDGQGAARTVARGLPVLATPQGGRGDSPAVAPDTPGGDLVLLGVPAAQVDDVIGASAGGLLLFAFSP